MLSLVDPSNQRISDITFVQRQKINLKYIICIKGFNRFNMLWRGSKKEGHRLSNGHKGFRKILPSVSDRRIP